MATDATGTPTSLGIPTYNVTVDAPSGNGNNAQMQAIDALIQGRIASPSGIAAGEVPVWNGSAWVRSSVTHINGSNIGTGVPIASLAGYPTNGALFLAGDGTWKAPAVQTYRKTAATTVNTSIAETDLLGISNIGASALGTTGTLRLTLIGLDHFNNSGGNVNFRWRLKFGGTPVLDTGNILVGAGAVRGPIAFTAIGMNVGATNSQVWHGFTSGMYSGGSIIGAAPLTTGEGTEFVGTESPMQWQSTSAVDTTVAQALTFTIQMGTSAALAEAKLLAALVEIV